MWSFAQGELNIMSKLQMLKVFTSFVLLLLLCNSSVTSVVSEKKIFVILSNKKT